MFDDLVWVMRRVNEGFAVYPYLFRAIRKSLEQCREGTIVHSKDLQQVKTLIAHQNHVSYLLWSLLV